MKPILFSVLFVLLALAGSAQLLSPDEYMGYKIGTQYTPTYKVDQYFMAVAAAKPSMVKVEPYGKTNEGRDLMLAYVALPENLQKLEEIRKNNLRLSGSLNDGTAPKTEGAPAIVWLSYNVHGNETSSSEAAMLTLYALVSDTSARAREWLKNTVVIMDPCVNPDGRDRYINWYKSVKGESYNPDPQAREHHEPWPGGRTNHYNFDLNRDWAWQTQVETQQRMKKYNDWLPQVHVDYHEQGVNAPYYFAPAAEPYHEAITPWQREFQVAIGKNNAGYFDANGWLYFTKQVFDLFYPSYGDTYPIYNGAIGMTFEQGGGPAGGLGILIDDGDTLTLVDRARHHFTTGMSTVETSSANAARLISEYQQFFANAANAVDAPYKTYVLTAKDKNQLSQVELLLQKNKIAYGITSSRSFKGYNYQTGKEEDYKEDGYQLVVSAYQPRGTLVRVLFEPKSTLKDSSTYDITAWSIPYVYNLKAYGVKERLPVQTSVQPMLVSNVQSNYGIIIPYTSFNSGKVLAYLLQKKVKVRFAEKPFTYDNTDYAAGTLIVLRGGNLDNWNTIVNEACTKFNVTAKAVETGFVQKGSDFGSHDVHFVHAPNVALVTGNQTSSLGAGEVWHYFDKEINYPVTLINADELARTVIQKYDVVIFPDGRYKLFDDKSTSDRLKSFVRSGGKIIAMQDAVTAMANTDWNIKLKDASDSSTDSSYAALRKYGSRVEEELTSNIPGSIYKLEMDNTHPLAYGYPAYYYSLKQDTNVFGFLQDGWNVGVYKKNGYVSGFVGSKAKPAIKDGLVFGVQNMGQGSVVFMADDPLFREFWDGGKLLFNNALFMVGQ